MLSKNNLKNENAPASVKPWPTECFDIEDKFEPIGLCFPA